MRQTQACRAFFETSTVLPLGQKSAHNSSTVSNHSTPAGHPTKLKMPLESIRSKYLRGPRLAFLRNVAKSSQLTIFSCLLLIAFGLGVTEDAWAAKARRSRPARPVSTQKKQARRPAKAKPVQAKRVQKYTQTARLRAPASAIRSEPKSQGEKVLKVHGQSRNLSMMFVLKEEKETIKFGEIRENFRQEVLKTSY